MKRETLNRLALSVTLLTAVVIAVLTLMPPGNMPRGVPGSDKFHHFIAFAALVFPVALVRPRQLRWVLPMAIAYGGLIEIIQPHFGRGAEWGDFIADVSGALFGAIAGTGLHRVWLARPGSRP